jgi:hypothetical protein
MHYLSGDQNVQNVALNQFEVDGEYTLFYEATTDRVHYETLLNGADAVRAMIVTFTGDAIGNAEVEEIKIKIPSFIIKERGVDTAVAGFITESPSFTAMYDTTEAKTVQVEITNTHAAY